MGKELLGSLELNRIYQFDCVEGMKTLLPDNCIDLTVTSPPYDGLRTYNGYSFDFENIAKELLRITKEGGVIVWIVGDSMIKGSKSLTSFRQALFFKELGFNIYDIIIYEKTSPSPPHKNRYFNSFEYMFIMSKGKPKTINLLKDRKNKCAGTSSGTLTRRESDGTLTTKKKIFIEDFGIRTNVWEYDVGNNKTTKDKIAFQHPAIFPEKLAEDHILSWSNEGDIVFDPFMGSGTTAKMAQINSRNWIEFEISPEYIEVANNRLDSLE
jgi:site-specific DNA-methyltransferase (adenine-specific)